MFKEQSIEGFAASLASSAAVPGGGGASALTGALGTGLSIMVGCLTRGKAKYAAVGDEINALTDEARNLLQRFLELIDADAQAFQPLSRAYAMPKDAPCRDEIMEKCLYDAALAPMETLRLCARAIELAERFAEIGSTLAVSDAGCAAVFCRAALEGSALNVFVNTRLMKDRARAQAMNKEVNAYLEKYAPMAERTYTQVKGKLYEQ